RMLINNLALSSKSLSPSFLPNQNEIAKTANYYIDMENREKSTF
ncbi:15110_t:CDS:1, partial [Gigaspora margarita]